MGLRKLNKSVTPTRKPRRDRLRKTSALAPDFRASFVAIAVLFVSGYILSHVYKPDNPLLSHIPSFKNTNNQLNKLASDLDSHIDEWLAHHVPPNTTTHNSPHNHHPHHAHAPAHHVHIDEIVKHVISNAPMLPPLPPSHCKEKPHLTPGDCQVVGLRRPPWACPEAIRKQLSTFAQFYVSRITPKINLNSSTNMRFNHAFALWYMLRALSPTPKTVIENRSLGRFSTWIIRHALPHTTIISIDPSTPPQSHDEANKIHRLSGSGVDFANVRWDRLNRPLNRSNAVVIFNDRQSSFRRIIEQGRPRGFRRFISITNPDFQSGKSMSMKWVCEKERKHEWKGLVSMDDGNTHERKTWEEHEKLSHELKSRVHLYYEFPPVVSAKVSHSTSFHDSRSAPPLLRDRSELERYVPSEGLLEFQGYEHVCFVETR